MCTQFSSLRWTIFILPILIATSLGRAEQVLMDPPPKPSGGSGVEGPDQEPQWVEVEVAPSDQVPPPLMQSDPPAPDPNGPETPAPLTPPVGTSFNGVINNPHTIKPPDTHIAVGPGAGTAGRVVEVTNADVQIFNKNGGTVAGPTTLNTFFGATVPPDARVFDPKVLFDQHSGRFFVVALQGNTSSLNKIHIAVSSSGTPGNLTTNWTKLNGSGVTTLGGVGTWADYPGIGADSNSLFITTNQFDNAKVFKGAKIRVFDKAALIGGTYTFVDINVDAAVTATAGTIQPAHVYGTTDSGGFYLISRFSSGFYQMFHVTGDPAAPVATNNTFAWTGGATPADTGADQCTVGNPDIDTLDPRMMQAVYRNAHVWCCYTADPDNDGQTEATWQDISTNNNAPTVNQAGFINGTGTNPWTYQPSININSVCTVAICYTQSSSTQCPSMNYATRLATDAPGTFQAPVQATASAGFYDATGVENPERWGDYSATVVDPDDDCFWIAHEFGNTSGAGTSTWGTFIAQFCEPNGSCPPPPEACCTGGTCSDLDPTVCTQNGGIPQGPGTTCATTQCGEACCFTSGACAMMTPTVCTFNGGTPQGFGTTCATVQCPPQIPKFSQPPTAGGEDVPSNIDLSDLDPNVVVADDFQSDGRPITFVRWWGSYIDQRYAPQQYGGIGNPPFNIDGWLVSFHEPLTTASNPPAPPLGLYFCETQYITITPESIPACDAHQVFEYYVQLSNCCLLHAQPDSRSGFTPAEPGEFDEEHCFRYDMDIQAVVGKEYATMGGGICSPPIATPNFANNHFWGWHSTTIENGIRQALKSTVTINPPNQWLYGPWTNVQPFCVPPPVNMSFELITSDPNQPPQCPPEACCMPDGNCLMLLPPQCVQNGGTPQGFGSNCAAVQCPQPPAACCFPDGSCSDLPPNTCIAQGGAPQGPGTTCATFQCPQPPEACCMPDGSCVDIAPFACSAQGGTAQGPGTTCATVNCPLSEQACCLPDGSCLDLYPNDCLNQGGSPQGLGTTCVTVQCPQPPIITTWRSVRFHGPGAPNGELSIVLHPTRSGNGTTGPTVETRGNASTGVGIRKIEVDFDQPVVLVNPAAITVTGRTTVGGVMQPPVGYLPASVVMVDADTMAITFGINALPNETCYRFDVLGSVQNGATQPLVGDTDCNVRSLQGDTTMNGEVTVSDQLATKAQVTAGATATAVPHFDVNLSGGTITITDQLLVKSQVGKKALCP